MLIWRSVRLCIPSFREVMMLRCVRTSRSRCFIHALVFFYANPHLDHKKSATQWPITSQKSQQGHYLHAFRDLKYPKDHLLEAKAIHYFTYFWSPGMQLSLKPSQSPLHKVQSSGGRANQASSILREPRKGHDHTPHATPC